MLVHTELFSNVSGLGHGHGLIHCGLGLRNFWASASIFLASASASCPAGLVNIPGSDVRGEFVCLLGSHRVVKVKRCWTLLIAPLYHRSTEVWHAL